MSFSAEDYENYSVPGLFAPWSSLLAEIVNPQMGERLLDVACGTGIVARRFAPLIGLRGNIIGLDVNPYMLRISRMIAEREGLTIKWCTSRAEHLPFPDGSFDLVVCQFGLMFFTDRQAALMEFKRVLRRGGRLGISVWQNLEKHPFYQLMHEVTRARLGISSVQSVFSLGDEAELHSLIANSGFHHVKIEPMSLQAHFQNPEAFLAWEISVDPAESPVLKNLDPGAQQGVLAAVRRELQVPMEKVTQDGQVRLTYHANIAYATNG